MKATYAERLLDGLIEILLLGALAAGYQYLFPGDSDLQRSFKVIAKQQISPSVSIITLGPEGGSIKNKTSTVGRYDSQWESGIWSIRIRHPILDISRSDKPLPPTEHDQPGYIKILVDSKDGNAVSSYISRLWANVEVVPGSAKVEVNIPYHAEKCLILANAESGIVPAMQALYTLLEGREKDREDTQCKKIHMAWTLPSPLSQEQTAEPMLDDDFFLPPAQLEPVYSTASIPNSFIFDELKALQQKHLGRLTIEFRDHFKMSDDDDLVDYNIKSDQKQIPNSRSKNCSNILLISGPGPWTKPSSAFMNDVEGRDADKTNELTEDMATLWKWHKI